MTATVDARTKGRTASVDADDPLLRDVFAYAAVGIAVLDEEGNFAAVNPALSAMLGYAVGEIRGRSLAMVFPPEDAAAALKAHRDFIGGGGMPTGEWRLRHKDGAFFTAGITAGRVIHKNGRRHLVVTVQDLGELKRAQEFLRETEKTSRALLDAFSGAAVLTTVEGVVLAANEAAARDLGGDRRNVLGRNLFDSLPPAVAGERRARAAKVAASRQPATFEDTDGARWFHVAIHPLGGKGGVVDRLAVFTRDVTARRVAEDGLRDQVEFQRTLIGAMPSPIYYKDTSGIYLGCNQAFADFVGRPVEEIVGKTVLDVAAPELAESYHEADLELLRRGGVMTYETLIRHADGTMHDVLASKSTFRRADGSVGGLIGTLVDITERKRAEDMLRSVAERVSGVVGESFFRTLVAYLATTLKVDYAFVGRLTADGRAVRTIAFFAHGRRVDDVEMPLEGTPCQQAIEREACFFESGLRQRFPASRLLAEMRAESYVGTPLTDSQQRPVGILAVLGERPLENPKTALSLLQIFAGRAAAEMDRMRAEAALRESEERYALAAQGANDGLWDWDLKVDAVFYSARWKQMLGCADAEVGTSPDEWFNRVHAEDLPGLKQEIAAHLEGAATHLMTECRVRHTDGGFRWVLVRGLAVRQPDGAPYRMAGSFTDITDRKRAEDQLLHDAFHDALTGLRNRPLFMDRLEQAIGRIERREGAGRYAVLVIDIDRFKVVNDSLGHIAGDELLMSVARRLEACIRPGDTLARFGGDEFTVLIEDVRDVGEAKARADQILAALTRPIRLAGREVFTSASIGIALGGAGTVPGDVLRNADLAMYRAKSRGRARYEVFEETMHASAVQLLEMETDLRRALERAELELHYQPIIDLRSGTLVAFEALLRWNHPQRGMIAPMEFIPLAEETGLIVPIGNWVLAAACRQMAEWRARFDGKAPQWVNVNVSGKQLNDAGLIDAIRTVLDETGVPGKALKVEITESVLMENPEATNGLLGRLRDLDIGLCIDDFGTGYSSFSYLHRFPIDTLKIDKSFVGRMGVNTEEFEIVRTILTLAETLGMGSVAEGVETADQVLQLRLLDCQYVQGFHFSRPVPAADAADLIARDQKW
jgi:diguanylate cyclase (GGDEF)-like protein/PAS domain S-box-containing protein